MLLHSYKITRTLPCLADPEKIRVIAEISGEIHEAFPYLNAILKGCIYNHPALTLTIKKDGKLFTLHAHHITLAKIEDEREAEKILGWLRVMINETYEKRDQIEPNYSMAAELKALDIFKLLPGTNCKKCGEPTCLAFAVKLVGRDTEITKCDPLFSEKYQEKRNVLLELLHAAGFEVPSEPLNSQKEFKWKAFSKLHAPVGLDIGAETPEEIAISIAAEIIAAKKGKLDNLEANRRKEQKIS